MVTVAVGFSFPSRPFLFAGEVDARHVFATSFVDGMLVSIALIVLSTALDSLFAPGRFLVG